MTLVRLPEFPIVQAPMAGVQDSMLAIAVSQAGGVGSLPCAMLSEDQLVQELECLRDAQLPVYNLNFFCHKQPDADPTREARWRDLLKPYYAEFGLKADDVPSGSGRNPFTEHTLELIRPFAPPIVSFHFGLPRRDWVDAINSWGGQVWSTATTLQEAIWLVDRGVDAVIAQGIEAGGHRGMFLSRKLDNQMGLDDLLKALHDNIDVPVIAAGGIAGPAAVQRVLELGAQAAQIGTAYLCCHEAKTSAIHRKHLMADGEIETAMTNLFSGRPARGITNRFMREQGPMSEITPEFPLAAPALAPLRAAAESGGRGDFSPLWCGTDASGCREVSAADQTRWLAGQAD